MYSDGGVSCSRRRGWCAWSGGCDAQAQYGVLIALDCIDHNSTRFIDQCPGDFADQLLHVVLFFWHHYFHLHFQLGATWRGRTISLDRQTLWSETIAPQTIDSQAKNAEMFPGESGFGTDGTSYRRGTRLSLGENRRESKGT
jgi:hypothetical protein